MILTNFWSDFYTKYIGYGEYQRGLIAGLNTTWGVFSKYHLILMISLLSGFVLFTYLTRNATSKNLEKYQKIVSIVMLVLEVFRTIWLQVYKDEIFFQQDNIIRYDYCNQVCLFLPILCLLGVKELYPFMAAVAFWGGGAVMLYPLNIFRFYGGWHIMPIQSMISHGLMFLSSINLTRIHKISLKHDFFISTIGFLMMAGFSLFYNAERGENFMAFKESSGVPIVALMPNPINKIAIISIVVLGIFLYLLVSKHFEQKFLCTDLKEKKSYDIQESDSTL